MYIYIYIYIYVNIHKYMHTHVYICIYMYSYKHAHVRTHAHTHISYVYICIHTHTHNICALTQVRTIFVPLCVYRFLYTNMTLSHEHGSLIPLCSVTSTILYYEPITKFWKCEISSHLVLESISGFWGRFFGCWTASKRGALVHNNSLASYQGCRHSIELRALTCLFKQSNLIAWSLLSWHPTHTYLWGRLCFIQVVRSPPSLFYYKDIKQKIVYTLLLEESGVSKKWLILMYKRQDSNATSTPAGKSGPSAQDHYCARGLGGGANKRRGNKEAKRQV